MKRKLHPLRLFALAFTLMSAMGAHAQSSVVLEEWPFTQNAQDSASIRDAGIAAAVPTMQHYYLSNGTTVTAIPAYSPTYGEAFGAGDGATAPGDGTWGTNTGGPGSTPSRVMYQEFKLTSATGYNMRIDSLLMTAAFYNTSSSTTVMMVYSHSSFVSDSTNAYGYTFANAGGVALLNQTGGPTAPLNTVHFGFVSGGTGVSLNFGDTLTVRLYFTCSSNSTGRYACVKNLIVEGATTQTSSNPPCLLQPGAIVASIPTICAGQAGASYTVPAVTGATSYTWAYSGTGATFTSATNSVSINYAATATSGTLSVVANAACGSSASRTLPVTVNAMPANAITTAGGATSICGGSLQLNANTGTGYTYQWLNSGSVIPSATTASYTTSAAGTFKVKVTTTAGCTDTSAAFTVTATGLQQPGVITADSASCSGATVAYSIAAVPGASTYTWSIPGYTPYTSAATSVGVGFQTVTIPTNIVLSVVANGTCGSSAPRNDTITIHPLPVNTIIAPQGLTVCPYNTISFYADSAAGYSYLWTVAGTTFTNTSSSVQAINDQPTSTASTAQLSLQITDAFGCSSISPAVTLTFAAEATVPFIIYTSGPSELCPGGSLALTLSPGLFNGNTVRWYYNNVPLSATSTLYTAHDTGMYSYIVTEVNGCTDTATDHVTSAAQPDAVTASGPVSFCTGGSVMLNVTTSTNTSYQWLNNGTAIPGATASSYMAAAVGQYSVKVTNNYNGCADTSVVTSVAVSAAPADAVTASGSLTFCAGNSVTLNVGSTTGATYQWLKNGSPVTNATADTFVATASGAYTVKVTGTGGTCTDTSAVTTVTANPLPVPVITENGFILSAGSFTSYAWSFNGTSISVITNTLDANLHGNGSYTVTVTDANGCTATSAAYSVTDVTGVNNVYAQAIQLYPNPAADIVHISSPIKVNVTVAGIDGKLLLHKDNAQNINVGPLAAGIYMLMVYDENNVLIKTSKLVKN